MPSPLLSFISAASSCFLAAKALTSLPDKIYGTNLGSWLVLEPWMLPAGTHIYLWITQWADMGGETCSDCSKCIRSEFAFAQAFPDTVDQKFLKHWESWFSQTDVDELKDNGINAVRIPLGYWIVEPLVNRDTEFYPRGGMSQLARGLGQLRSAGIAVILDHHALPGVASPNQMFAGRCTSDVEFYTPGNYHRALIWTGVMTAVSHLHPNFDAVAALEAINEPIMDASKTPGYGDFQKNFVHVVRAVELALGVQVPDQQPPAALSSAPNVTSAFSVVASSRNFNTEVNQVLADLILVFSQVASQLELNTVFDEDGLKTKLACSSLLITSFMDVNWQYNSAPNPANAAMGPQYYDNHLYYSFGGVAAANEQAYLTHNCNLNRVAQDASVGNTPLFFGEWSLATQFSATDAFLMKWADSQKMAYSKGAGWLFWNFKIEVSDAAGDTARQWSYMEGIRRGYFTKDPSQLNDQHVCDAYITTA